MRFLCISLLLFSSCSPEINSPEWMRGEWEDAQAKGVSYRFDGKSVYVKSVYNSDWKSWVDGIYPFCRVNQEFTDSTFTVQFLNFNKEATKFFIYKRLSPNSISVRDSTQEEIHNYDKNTIELSPSVNTWEARLIKE